MMTKDERACAHLLEMLLGSSQRHVRRRRMLCGALIVLIWALTMANFARAGFTTIINSPPTDLRYQNTLESNTQLNIYSGGALPPDFDIGPRMWTVDNIEINLLGGTIGSEGYRSFALTTSDDWSRASNVTVNLVEGTVWGGIAANRGALVNLSNAMVNGDLRVYEGSLLEMSGGEISGWVRAGGGSMVRMLGGMVNTDVWGRHEGTAVYDGSVFLMSGGTIGGYFSVDDSYAWVTGGRIDGEVSIRSNGLLEAAGGTFGHVTTAQGGELLLSGGEFRLNGAPAGGLLAYTKTIDFPEGSVLTGVLADGTPVVLSNAPYLHDLFADNQITLQAAPVPAAEPRHYDSSIDDIPAGLRDGQSLTLRPRGVVPVNFAALPGSSITIDGGTIGSGFEASGASITMTSGSIGTESAIFHGTTLQMFGGEIGADFVAGPGSRLEVKGGLVDYSLLARPESEVVYSGGKMAEWLNVNPGSSFTVAGGEFRINGTPVAGLSPGGSVQQIDLPQYGVLSGTLEDGTPFALGASESVFAPGTLKLQAAAIPAPGPMVFRVPSDVAPQGLRSGQTLFLADGGEVGEYFTADWGSTVRMTGGRIGYGFQAVGGFVNISGGEVESFKALVGSVVNISGGSVSYQVSARKGAIVNVSGGVIGEGIDAYNGGRVNISGGTVNGRAYIASQSSIKISGGVVAHGVTLYGNSSLTVEGGNVSGIDAYYGSQVELRGGRLGDRVYVGEQGRAMLRGSDIRIDGVPLADDDSLGWYGTLDLPQGAVLSGVFDDGTPFAFTSSEGDWFESGTLKVMSSPSYYAVRDISSILFPRVLPQGVRPGESLTLEAGQDVGTNFTAGWDSTLSISGGVIGDNFEAVGATVNLLAGSIGNELDVLFGTDFNVLGGEVGYGLQAHRGSVLNMAGGFVADITARSGSVINITGGALGRYFGDEFVSGGIAMEAGSTVNITGSEFVISGELIEVEPGGSVTLDWDQLRLNYSSLSGVLADGSPFYAFLADDSWSIPDNWQRQGPRTIILTAAVGNLQVPELAGPELVMIVAVVVCVGRMWRQVL